MPLFLYFLTLATGMLVGTLFGYTLCLHLLQYYWPHKAPQKAASMIARLLRRFAEETEHEGVVVMDANQRDWTVSLKLIAHAIEHGDVTWIRSADHIEDRVDSLKAALLSFHDFLDDLSHDDLPHEEPRVTPIPELALEPFETEEPPTINPPPPSGDSIFTDEELDRLFAEHGYEPPVSVALAQASAIDELDSILREPYLPPECRQTVAAAPRKAGVSG